MKKIISTIAVVSLTACSDNHPQQYAQQPVQYQQQYTQQGIPVQGQAPIINNGQPQQTDSSNTALAAVAGLAVGAAAAHIANNLDDKPSYSDHKNERSYTSTLSTPNSQNVQTSNVANNTVIPTKESKNAMDMNKFAASANYRPPSEQQSNVAKPNGMDMSKLASKPSVNFAKPVVSNRPIAIPSRSFDVSKLKR